MWRVVGEKEIEKSAAGGNATDVVESPWLAEQRDEEHGKTEVGAELEVVEEIVDELGETSRGDEGNVLKGREVDKRHDEERVGDAPVEIEEQVEEKTGVQDVGQGEGGPGREGIDGVGKDDEERTCENANAKACKGTRSTSAPTRVATRRFASAWTARGQKRVDVENACGRNEKSDEEGGAEKGIAGSSSGPEVAPDSRSCDASSVMAPRTVPEGGRDRPSAGASMSRRGGWRWARGRRKRTTPSWATRARLGDLGDEDDGDGEERPGERRKGRKAMRGRRAKKRAATRMATWQSRSSCGIAWQDVGRSDGDDRRSVLGALGGPG